MAKFKLSALRDFIPRTFELFNKKSGQPYNLKLFGRDCISGITVGIIALPLAMAFSIAAGGSPAQGLYTAIVAGFFISFLSGSKFQIGGPTGAFVVIIFGVISRHGMDGLITATILAGFMLIIMGLSGLGRFIKYIPYPVTTGFTTGIGLLIFFQQLKDFFGFQIEQSSPEFFEKFAEYIEHAPTFQPSTLVLGLGTITVMILLRKFVPRIPGAVAGVILATLACHVFSIPVDTIGSRFGGIPSSFPMPAMPVFSYELIRGVLPDAFTIALLAAIESLLSSVVADGMTGDRHNANMELVAQGVGNMASALVGGIPATGAIARTAANIKAGAVSPISGIIHAITLLLFVIFLSPLASMVPLASLAAVLMMVAWDMSAVPRFANIFRKAPKSDAIVLLTTFVLTVIVDLTFAVEIGVLLAVFLFMRRMVEVTGIKPGTKDIREEILLKTPEGSGTVPEHSKYIEVYEITGPFFFGVADTLQRTLRILSKAPHAFILRMRDVPAIDSTGIAALESFLIQCRHQKTALFLCEIREQPMKALKKAGFVAELGKENIADTLKEVLERAEKI